MVKIEALAMDDALDGIPLDFHSKFFLEIITQPEIVITRKIGQCNTGMFKVGEFGKEAYISLWNDGPVFKPEIKEVADNEEVFTVLGHLPEELNQCIFFSSIVFFGTDSEVGI